MLGLGVFLACGHTGGFNSGHPRLNHQKSPQTNHACFHGTTERRRAWSEADSQSPTLSYTLVLNSTSIITPKPQNLIIGYMDPLAYDLEIRSQVASTIPAYP